MNRRGKIERLDNFNEAYSLVNMKERKNREKEQQEFLNKLLPAPNMEESTKALDLTEVAETTKKALDSNVQEAAEQTIQRNEEEGKKQAQTKEKTKSEKVLEKLNLANGITDKIDVPKLSDLPTPGGIGILVLIILFIVFALMPYKDGTNVSRLGLVWRVLIGEGTLREKPMTEKEISEGFTELKADTIETAKGSFFAPPIITAIKAAFLADKASDLKTAMEAPIEITSASSVKLPTQAIRNFEESLDLPSYMGGW